MAGGNNKTNSEKLDDLTQMLLQFQESVNLRMDTVTGRIDSLER
jgi:hypothetical protein